MYNPYNPYTYGVNPMDRIDNQIRELENLKKGYQNMPQQPTQNIFNVGNSPQTDFEAVILNENQNPNEILVKHKTMFFEPKKGKLSIKEINGDITSYDVIMPKDEKDIKIEELERKIKEYEYELSTINSDGSTNEKNGKSTEINEPNATKDTKRVPKEK